MSPRIALQLIPAEELGDDASPEACVEILFGPVHPASNPDTAVIPQPMRIAPADLVRLRMEAELALGEIRTEVLRAELAWKQQLGAWYEEGRAAVESREPDVALLVRVLEGLRRDDPVPT